MQVRVFNIEWETDGKKIDGLPSEITISLDDKEWAGHELDDVKDQAIDAASKSTGWLIANCNVELR